MVVCLPSAWAASTSFLPFISPTVHSIPPRHNHPFSTTTNYGVIDNYHSHVTASQPGLVLSPAAEPFPQKVVEKIRAGNFVELKELLPDNIALLNQLETVQGSPPAMFGAARPRLREVQSLPTWCYCFLGYMAICTTDPATRDQLAYARLLIKEAQRHGGQGWLDYDRAFRQQAAADPSLRWNTWPSSFHDAGLSPARSISGFILHTLPRGRSLTGSVRLVEYPAASLVLHTHRTSGSSPT